MEGAEVSLGILGVNGQQQKIHSQPTQWRHQVG